MARQTSTTKSELAKSRIGMAFRRTQHDEEAEKRQLAKKLNTNINTMSSGEIVMRLYKRHSTGFWMTWSILLGVAAVYGAIT